MDVTVLGSGSPIPDAHRAGPSGLVRGGDATVLVDAGRGVLMRLTAAGLLVPQLSAVLLTHLHSDHTTDLGDVITTWWVMPMTSSKPLRIIGPPGTAAFVDATIGALEHDIGYRIAHHDDLEGPPVVAVTEVDAGTCFDERGLHISTALVDHGVVKPALGYRFAEDGGGSACWAGDTVPCPGLDELCAGVEVYVQTVIRRSLVEQSGIARFTDILDYHSDLADAGRTASRAGVRTLVLNHPVPAPAPGTEGEWIAEAAAHFEGDVRLAVDLDTFTA